MRQRCGAPARARIVGRVRAVDQHVTALAPEHHAGRSAAVGRLEHAAAVEADVAQHQRDRVGHADAVLRVFDQQRAVEAVAGLGRRVDVRVIPVERGVADDEVVGERLALLQRGLRDVGYSVHGDRDPHAVPVHGRRLVELVGEVDDQAIADVGPDERSRNAAVVGPRLYRLARRDLNIGDSGGDVHLDDARVGIHVHRLDQPRLGVPSLRREAARRFGTGGGGQEESSDQEGSAGVGHLEELRGVPSYFRSFRVVRCVGVADQGSSGHGCLG